MSNFPSGFDAFVNPSGSSPQNNPAHHTQHSDANDAIEALEAKVGVDNSAVTTSLDYKVRHVLDGNVSVGTSLAVNTPAAQAGGLRLVNNVTPVYAQGILTLAAHPSVGKTVVINGRSYSWVSGTPSNDNEIDRGADLAAAKANFIDAINNGDYWTGVENADVSATAFNADNCTLIAKVVGVAGNSVTLGGTLTDDSGNQFDAATLGNAQAGIDGTYTGFVEARNALNNADVLLLGLDSSGRTVLSDASLGMGVYVDPVTFGGLLFLAGNLGFATLTFSGARDPDDFSHSAPQIQISIEPATGELSLTGGAADALNTFRAAPAISMTAKQWDGNNSQPRTARILTEVSEFGFGDYRMALSTTGAPVRIGNGALILENTNFGGNGIVSPNNSDSDYTLWMVQDGTHLKVGAGNVILPSLPTSDPVVAGQLWNSSGTLKVSAG